MLSALARPRVLQQILSLPTCFTHVAPQTLVVACHQLRKSSHSPMGTPSKNPRKRVTLSTLRSLHKAGDPIAMVTAHDFPSAHVADAAGMDIILVGDSLAMVALGMEDTSEVLLDEMLLHCRSVARATKSAFTVRHTLLPSTKPPRSHTSRLAICPWARMRSPQPRLSR